MCASECRSWNQQQVNFGHPPATSKDISNLRQSMLAGLVGERTTTEALLNLLHEKGYHFKFDRSAEGPLLR